MKKTILTTICLIAIFTFTNAQCKCGETPTESRWDGIGFRIGDGELKKYKCGYQFSLKTTQVVKFQSGQYNCIGETADCKATYSALLYRGTAIVTRFATFDFSSEIVQFATPGSYKLVLEASCNKTKCNQCIYYFTVK
jgi:hypothetical protein